MDRDYQSTSSVSVADGKFVSFFITASRVDVELTAMDSDALFYGFPLEHRVFAFETERFGWPPSVKVIYYSDWWVNEQKERARIASSNAQGLIGRTPQPVKLRSPRA